MCILLSLVFFPQRKSILNQYHPHQMPIWAFFMCEMHASLMNVLFICLFIKAKFVNFLKIRLTFILFYCFWMFVNKFFTYISCAYLSIQKRCFNVKSLAYYFHVKTKLLTDFQICIGVNTFKLDGTATSKQK